MHIVRKVVVTGGTGFLGGRIVRGLTSKGYAVTFTGRNVGKGVALANSTGAKFVRFEHGIGDESLVDHCHAADAVVHCAGLSSPWGQQIDFMKANVDSAREVVHACAKSRKGLKLVHISTPSIYASFIHRKDILENDQLPEPINTYAQTKREGEEIILNQGPRETIVLRPRGIFGPGDETLLPRLIKVMRKGPVPLVNDGKALIDVTHVDNVVLAVELALAKELALGEKIYNVSNGEPIEVREILSMVADRLSIPLKTINVPWPILKTAAWTMESLAKVTGKEPAITQYTASTLAFTQTLNISAIRKDLGYEPIVSVKEGIASLPLGEAC